MPARKQPAVPYLEIVIPLEGRARGAARGCGGNWDVRARVLDWVESDADGAEIIAAFRRLRDRQAGVTAGSSRGADSKPRRS